MPSSNCDFIISSDPVLIEASFREFFLAGRATDKVIMKCLAGCKPNSYLHEISHSSKQKDNILTATTPRSARHHTQRSAVIIWSCQAVVYSASATISETSLTAIFSSRLSPLALSVSMLMQ